MAPQARQKCEMMPLSEYKLHASDVHATKSWTDDRHDRRTATNVAGTFLLTRTYIYIRISSHFAATYRVYVYYVLYSTLRWRAALGVI